jgi:erythromycin esterase-like protein
MSPWTHPSQTGPATAVDAAAHPIVGIDDDHAPLLALTARAQLVLLGEAAHRTHEFYRERARITRRLIGEQGFAAVAVEADWPDAYRVNQYVRGVGVPHRRPPFEGRFVPVPQSVINGCGAMRACCASIQLLW